MALLNVAFVMAFVMASDSNPPDRDTMSRSVSRSALGTDRAHRDVGAIENGVTQLL
jgi:hypothetical protein